MSAVFNGDLTPTAPRYTQLASELTQPPATGAVVDPNASVPLSTNPMNTVNTVNPMNPMNPTNPMVPPEAVFVRSGPDTKMKKKEPMTTGERVCGLVFCLPCIGWSLVCRLVCCPCDCMAGHPCGGNGCTTICDDACFLPFCCGFKPIR